MSAGAHPDEPHAPEGDVSAPAVSTRTILLGAALVVVLAVGLLLLLGKLAGYSQVLDTLQGASGLWLVACFVLEIISFAAYVVSLHAVIADRGGPRLRPVSTVRLWLASVGATRLIAPAGAGGVAIIYWLLKRTPLSARDRLGKVLGFNILIFALFGAWAFATALVIALAPGNEIPIGITLPWIIGVPIIGAAGLWVSQGRRGERLAGDTAHGFGRRALAGAVAGLIVARQVIAPRRPDAPAFWGAIAYWTADVACLWAALSAIGADVTLHGVGLAYATAYVTMLLPLPTGGYGAIDAAATFALTVLGVPLAEAVAGVVVWRVFNFWLPTLPGLIELARAQGLGRRLSAETGHTMSPAAATPRA